jgi:hypothetical protein
MLGRQISERSERREDGRWPRRADEGRADVLTVPPRVPVKQAGPRYSAAVSRIFQAVADDVTDLMVVDRLLDEEHEASQALGTGLAGVLRETAAEAWADETGRCPWCGGARAGCREP